MKKKYILIASLFVLILSFLVVVRRSRKRKVTEVTAPPATGVCKVKSLEKISEGAFPKYSPDASLITFTKEVVNSDDPHGIGYEIYTIRPDGSGVKCLTCDKAGLANTRWRGQPYWHPSGEYLVFTAETGKYPRKGIGAAARPGIGRNHNVWIMNVDGSNFWQVTDYRDNWGSIRPSFSHDGSKIFWNEEFMMEKYPQGKPEDPDPHPGCYWGWDNFKYRKGEELCAWRVKYADISFETGEPVVFNIQTINPPQGFTVIEAEGFMPDDSGFIYSYCDIKKEKGRCFCGDIYVSDLGGNLQENLTDTAGIHDEDSEFSPDGKKLAWHIATGGYPGEQVDLFLMDANGGNKERLTYFTVPGHDEYDPDAKQITELSWHPNGKSIILGHVSSKEERGPHLPSILYKLTFEGFCGNSEKGGEK